MGKIVGHFSRKPSDLGYSDEGYQLPKINVHYHEVGNIERDIKTDRDGNVVMYSDASKSLQDAAREKGKPLCQS